MEVVELHVLGSVLEVCRVDVCRDEAPSWACRAAEERVDAAGAGASGGYLAFGRNNSLIFGVDREARIDGAPYISSPTTSRFGS